jgi:NAD+ diphosphatase
MPSASEFAGTFRFCPRCGERGLRFIEEKKLECPNCGLEYFHNVAAAAGVLIDREGKILFLRRALDPMKGFLGLPGGFVNPGERAEDAVIRECREEIGWAPSGIAFLASFPNVYRYAGIDYHTCDIYFCARMPTKRKREPLPDNDEASAIAWFSPDAIPVEELAFPSLRRAIEAYGALDVLAGRS